MKAGYEALAQLPSVPLRLSLYHVAAEASCGEPLRSSVDADLLHKNGIKLWADGSPWVGNVGLSFTYLDTPITRAAGLAGLDTGGERSMNYSRDDLSQIIATHAPQGWQFAVHVNGDVSLDAVLDVLEGGLDAAGLSGTDHRWRVEHLGAARAEQFARIAALGVHASMGPFQFIYWGDVLDGQVFEHEVGANWQRFGDAVSAGLRPSFHNDGPVSPPLPLLNVQTALTRRTSSGAVRGEAQRISMDQALAAVTIHGAEALRREHKVGSITAGKLADFVELSADPYTVDPDHLTDQVQVQGTWLSGERIDLGAFLAAAGASDPTEHSHLHTVGRACC
jgi:predicted amidohydrolase YtcJ